MLPAQHWDRNDYRVSTDPTLLQVDAINDALASDMVWWAGDLPASALHEALKNSMCFGLYHKRSAATGANGVDSSSDTSDTEEGHYDQIGMARVITDGVTFGYLTDYYILEEHQGSGLGRWMLEVLNEVLQGWPHLRRVMLLTTDKMHLFGKNLGMKDWSQFEGMKGVSIAMKEGPGVLH